MVQAGRVQGLVNLCYPKSPTLLKEYSLNLIGVLNMI